MLRKTRATHVWGNFKASISMELTAWKVSVFGDILVKISRIRTEYREIPRISLYSVRMWENTGQNNSEYGHISRSDYNANRNNMQQNSFIKVYWIRYGFEVARDSPYLKSRNISCYQTINWKPDSCFWFVRKVKKMIKTNL